MTKIIQQLIDTKAKNGNNNKKKYITIHETDNMNPNANAQAHANLQKRGYKASWHYQIDQNNIIQSFTHDYQLHHSNNNKGNNESISIEMCVNKGNNYIMTIKNTIKLVKKIMKDENISIVNVVTHQYWNNKDCPKQLLSGSNGITWKDFINSLEGQLDPPKDFELLKIDGYLGEKTIKRLQNYLGTIEDGFISKPSNMIKELQRRLNNNQL